MGKVKDKLIDWKNRLKDRHMLSIIAVLVAILIILGLYTYKKQRDFRQASENLYNMAFFELVDYVQNVETYLAKSLISSSAVQGAESLTNVWREANLAGAYLAQLPIDSNELEKTSKFLNQVSDYSYSLSRKNIKGEKISEEDMNNLENLHKYSVELENTLNQLSLDLNEGKIKWGELNKKGSAVFATQTSNISKDSFSNLEENFHEYSGLIYDGAFSEHITNSKKKGLTGENIDENKAKEIAVAFIGNQNIEKVESQGKGGNANITAYSFNVKLKDQDRNVSIAISEKGGHIVYMDSDREIQQETISEDKAVKIGKEFLQSKGLNNMTQTYYLKNNGIVTINYAYLQDNVIMYSDLIKVKVALDNGEVLGIETTGYLNSHYTRNIPKVKITEDEAKKNLNKKLEINSLKIAFIPTEWKTEVFCYEFTGKINDMDFLVYVNAQTGEEEDILLIVNTPNGTLTH